MECKLKINRDDCDDYEFSEFQFEFRTNEMSTSIYFSNDTNSKTKWEKLMEAFVNNKNHTLYYSRCNGEISIELKNGFAKFTTSTYGGESSGDISVSMKLENCTDVFNEALKSFQ